MATVQLTADNFQQTIESNDIVLLDFWADWCGPCKMFAPVYEAASDKHTDIVFGKIDTEAEQELAGAAEIQAIPTLMAFREGIAIFREAGAMPAAGLEALIADIRELDMEDIKRQVAEYQAQHGHDHDHDHDHGDHEGHNH